MNLIVSRSLCQAERQLIDELTLKKRRSKKSTMSEKQVRARQQLAKELEHERLPHQLTHSMSHQQLTGASRLCSVLTRGDSMDTGINMTLNLSSASGASNSGGGGGGSCGCSFSRSDSSYSGSSQDSGMLMHSLLESRLRGIEEREPRLGGGGGDEEAASIRIDADHRTSHANASAKATTSSASSPMMIVRTKSNQSGSGADERQSQAKKKEADIRFAKSKLEHLNDELERRLYQYEYLVAKEKALLNSYNLLLFTNEGVNNLVDNK